MAERFADADAAVAVTTRVVIAETGRNGTCPTDDAAAAASARA